MKIYIFFWKCIFELDPVSYLFIRMTRNEKILMKQRTRLGASKVPTMFWNGSDKCYSYAVIQEHRAILVSWEC
jgi:hypothetical protein